MIGDNIVVDGISHAQDMRPDRVLPAGEILRDLNQQINDALPVAARVPGRDAVGALPTADNMCNSIFLESDVDVAVTHHLPLYSYVEGGLVPIEANQALADRAPARWVVYAGVDPTAGVAEAIESLEQQVDLLPQTVGLKLYPVHLNPLRTLQVDKEEYYPLWERARELGIRVISVHKAVPYGPVPIHPFRVEDVAGAAGAFPDLAFEIMHGGVAFVEETAMMISRFDNVYTNLEGLGFMQYQDPGSFEKAIASFQAAGAIHKVIWGTGGPQLGHPQFYLQNFLKFQFSQEVLDAFQIDPLTEEQRFGVLGRNFLGMAGIDVEELKGRLVGDEYDQKLRRHGRLEPMFSTWTPTASEQSDQKVRA